MKKLLLLLTFAIGIFTIYGQDYHKTDSLKKVLSTTPGLDGTDRDTARMQICLEIGNMFRDYNPDSAIWWYMSCITDTSYLSSTIKIYPNRAKIMAQLYGFSGDASLNKSDYQNATFYLKCSQRIFKELNHTKNHTKCLTTLAVIEGNKGNYLEANSYLEQALEESEKTGNLDAVSACLANMGIIAGYLGKYNDAVLYHTKSLEICEKLGDETGISSSKVNLGIIALEQGNYSEAISYTTEALDGFEKLGEMRPLSNCLTNIGIIKAYQGNFKESVFFHERSLKISEEIDDKAGISSCLINMGQAQEGQGNFKEAVNNYNRALDILKEIGHKPWYSNCLVNLGGVAWKTGNYSEAISFYEQANKLYEEMGEMYGVSICLTDMAGVLVDQGHYSEAVTYYENALKINEELGNKAVLVDLYSILALTLIKTGKMQEVPELLRKSIKLTHWLLKDNFTIMSENDKEMYLAQTKGIFNELNSFSINYPDNEDSLSGTCYTNELIIKGLLLKSTSGIMDIVYNSQDSVLQNAYWMLKQYRNQSASLQGTGSPEQDSLKDDLDRKINEQERILVKLSSEFANIQRLFDYHWTDVQKNIKPGEAAIEFVSFSTGNKSDTITYAALLITPDCKWPVAIKLFNDIQLKNITDQYKKDDFHRITRLYGTNQKINSELYELIWRPLEQYLSGVKTIYFAPVGVLNKISFSALGDGKHLLSDKYDLFQLSSTGKLIKQESFSLKNDLNVVVFGGIDYDADSSATESDLIIGWQFLPGTMSEKENIQKQLKKKKVLVTGFSGKEASELAFKSLYTDKKTSPDILHIATHGFFFPDPKSAQSEENYDIERGSVIEIGDVVFRGSAGCATWQFVNNKNPMMRSGLALAGANRVWTQEWGRTDDEGVLTALEVSHLNMKNTDLVVLSACETGLGDIKGSEGVYGLQRAFKMAGVKYIIMSLWQVPDKETQEFMTLFYSKLLKVKPACRQGRDVRTAFVETQKEMRAKYDPYFWGAFVLVE